jgi:hypothetical protein
MIIDDDAATPGERQPIKPFAANAGTVEAMKAARHGELTTAGCFGP